MIRTLSEQFFNEANNDSCNQIVTIKCFSCTMTHNANYFSMQDEIITLSEVSMLKKI